MVITKSTGGFPFLPGDRVFIEPREDLRGGHVLFPIYVTDKKEKTYAFETYELGKEEFILYIREGLWRYDFGPLSNGMYYFSESYMDDSDKDNWFRSHLH